MRGLEVKLPALVEERLQRHGIHVGAVLVASEGPKVKDQKAGCYVQRPVRQEHDKSGAGRPLSRPKFNVRRGWKLKSGPAPHTKLASGPSIIGFLGEKKNSGVRSPRPNSVSPIPGPKICSAAPAPSRRRRAAERSLEGSGG